MMSSRREFLAQAGLFMAATAIAPNFACSTTKSLRSGKNMGLQLYSLRDVISKDLNGVIAKVAEAGYTQVETYGYSLKDGFWGLKPTDFKKLLDANGLYSPSGHFGFDSYLEGKGDDEVKINIEAAKILGSEYITVPFLQENVRKTADDYKKLSEKLNVAGSLCKASGLKVAYHNHDFEFHKMGDTTGYEILLKQTDRSLVDFELDLYWVVRSGNDPIRLFTENPGRFTMWHVKDMDKTNKDFNAEVGSGAIDFKTIFADAKLSGMKHFFVEHETNYKPDEIGSVTASAKYIKENLL